MFYLDTDLNGGNYGDVYLSGLGKLYTMRLFWGNRGWSDFMIIHVWYKPVRGKTLKDLGLSRSQLTLFWSQITQLSCLFAGQALHTCLQSG